MTDESSELREALEVISQMDTATTKRPMTCPHCSTQAVFESRESVSFKPTIEKWVYDRAPVIQRTKTEFICLNCENRVKIDVRSRIVTALPSEPIFDEFVERVIRICRKKPDSHPPENIVKSLKEEKRFKGLSHLMTCRELLLKIIEQKE